MQMQHPEFKRTRCITLQFQSLDIMASNSDRALQQGEHSTALQPKHLQLHNQPLRRTNCTAKSFSKLILMVSHFLHYMPPLLTDLFCLVIQPPIPLPHPNPYVSRFDPLSSLTPRPSIPPRQHGCQSCRDPCDSYDLFTILRALTSGRHFSQTSTLCYQLLNKLTLATQQRNLLQSSQIPMLHVKRWGRGDNSSVSHCQTHWSLETCAFMGTQKHSSVQGNIVAKVKHKTYPTKFKERRCHIYLPVLSMKQVIT